jgi:hypothetical protein
MSTRDGFLPNTRGCCIQIFLSCLQKLNQRSNFNTGGFDWAYITWKLVKEELARNSLHYCRQGQSMHRAGSTFSEVVK